MIKVAFPLLLLTLLLGGCSAHPGSGSWLADDPDASGYRRLVVQFDGKAEFFRPGSDESSERCFWSGESDNSIQLDCALAGETEPKRHYRLVVDGPGRSQLIRGGQPVGRFHRPEE